MLSAKRHAHETDNGISLFIFVNKKILKKMNEPMKNLAIFQEYKNQEFTQFKIYLLALKSHFVL